MGFAGYFLIVADFINWAKSNGVPVGPGRGSGAGSLVAYALGITDLDPLKYDLLFERFLNPERVSMPDFDIDFCQDGRDRVIDYVRKKYGEESVSQIATFGTMAARAVVRDCGRVLDLGYSFCDQLAKLDPGAAGKADHAGRGAQDGAAARRAREERGRGARAARARRQARGPGAQRRHARGRRADRARPADRLLSALCRRRRAGRHLAARQGRRRGGRPRQVRLPRPHHAHHPRLGRALCAPAGRQGFCARARAARRCADLQAALLGQHHRGVPARIARHARPHQARAAGPLRGRDRAGRALSPGSDGPHSRLHRAQARPEARRVPRSRACSRSSARPTASWSTRSR